MPHDGHDHSHAPKAHVHAHNVHAYSDAAPAQPPLERGAGIGKVLYLDAPSGLAGDMMLAALVDLGVPWHEIEHGLQHMSLHGYELRLARGERHAVSGLKVDVHVKDGQPPRDYAQIRDLIESSSLSAEEKDGAQRAFALLAKAEAQVHHTSIEDVHFHEVGAVDSIVDMVGVAIALEFLGAELCVSPLPFGTGFVTAAHGQIPQPAPAVVLCLAGHQTYGVPDAFEFVTPTGAALVGALGKTASVWPAGRVLRAGWGLGSKDRKERPNALRAVLIDPAPSTSALSSSDERSQLVELAANLDDMTGEELAELAERLRDAGAVDVWTVQAIGKKGRPLAVVHALVHSAVEDNMQTALFANSRTLGVRSHVVTREELARELHAATTKYGEIQLKVAARPGLPVRVKAEFEDCARAAREHGVTLSEVRAEAERVWFAAQSA